MDYTDVESKQPLRKKQRISEASSPSSSPSSSPATIISPYLDIKYKGCPLFLLLELLPQIPQLDDEKLIRSVYDADVSTVKRGWSDWFYKVLRGESNDDRCRIFDATFRIIPELGNQKVNRNHAFQPSTAVLPLVDIVRSWPEEGCLPIKLLDQLTLAPSYLMWGAVVDCRCTNKNDVAMWAIQKKLLNNISEGYVVDAMKCSFSVDIVIALADLASRNAKMLCPFLSGGQGALGHALAAGGQYWNERLLRLLWRNTSFWVRLDTYMPEWFRHMVLEEARTAPYVHLEWPLERRDLNFALLVMRELKQSTSLTQLDVSTYHRSKGFVDALHDVLHCCSSLRAFYFDGDCKNKVRIPLMKNLDTLSLENACVSPESLGPMMSTAKRIRVYCCSLDFREESASSVLPDCFEGWADGLAQNHRIESLIIKSPLAYGRFRVCGKGFKRALLSRPNLERILLLNTNKAKDFAEDEFGLDLETMDMRQLGLMASLEWVELWRIPRNGLKSLFGARPSSLRQLHIHSSYAMTKEDYVEYLDYLSAPECKLSLFLGRDATPLGTLVGHENDHLKDPIRSFINVLRDKNSTLTIESHVTDSFPSVKKREISFWCAMNRTCPNRLQLRQHLSYEYVYRIEKYLAAGSHSKAFELIRSTFHLWGRH